MISNNKHVPPISKEGEGGEAAATRVMIFSQYRDSVQEITACLHEHRPLVKVMEFVGQAGTKGKSVTKMGLAGLSRKGAGSIYTSFRN